MRQNWIVLGVVLLLFAVSSVGCATNSPGAIEPPAMPAPPPELMRPPPSESYSERAQRNIRIWLETLTSSPRD